jgi:hypothetical protein
VNLDISKLGEVERWILVTQYERLLEGQRIYGPWPLEGRDNFYEAVLEVLDRNNYMAGEEVRKAKATASAPDAP